MFGRKDKKQQEGKEKLSKLIRGKLENLTFFTQEKISWIKTEISELIKKCQNLRDTNYQLGLKHLENGHLPEAIFRFRFIKKFWPDHYDSHYQLAYCLALNKKLLQARVVLKELLRQKPDYEKAQDLLDQIDANLSQNSHEKI